LRQGDDGVPVGLGDGVGRHLAHVRRAVLHALFDGERNDRYDDLEANARHDVESLCADELVRVVEILLEGVDREQRGLGLELGVVHQVHVHELLQLEPLAHNVDDDVREERRHVTAFGDHLWCWITRGTHSSCSGTDGQQDGRLDAAVYLSCSCSLLHLSIMHR